MISNTWMLARTHAPTHNARPQRTLTRDHDVILRNSHAVDDEDADFSTCRVPAISLSDCLNNKPDVHTTNSYLEVVPLSLSLSLFVPPPKYLVYETTLGGFRRLTFGKF
jgi:hypothetical protein